MYASIYLYAVYAFLEFYKNSKCLRTFTIGFNNKLQDDKWFDSQTVGTNWTFLVCNWYVLSFNSRFKSLRMFHLDKMILAIVAIISLSSKFLSRMTRVPNYLSGSSKLTETELGMIITPDFTRTIVF